MRSPVVGILVGMCLVAAGCEPGSEQADGAAEPRPGASSRVDSAAAVRPADTAAGDHAGHGDAGAPAPLIVIMRKLNEDMIALTTALMTEDRDGVVSSAAAIADHAPIAQEDLERIGRELGPEMADFERLDEEVHEASIQLSEMARSGQMYEVIDRLAEVQRGCIACHTLYRTRLATATVSQ